MAVDLEGKRFGKLVVTEYIGGKYYKWKCICDCGNEKIVSQNNLKSGNSKSCGCLHLKGLLERNIRHGLCEERAYKVHQNIMSRCNNKKAKDHKDYGGRGISICDEWGNDNDGIENFVNWCLGHSGYKEGLQIDRRDNDGNYEPSNCRFVTNRENSLNQRKKSNNTSGYVGISFDKRSGKWHSRIKINYRTINLRLHSTKQQAVEARNSYIKENNLEHEYKIQEWRGDE